MSTSETTRRGTSGPVRENEREPYGVQATEEHDGEPPAPRSGHGHHVGMMILCCALPIAGIAAVAWFGIRSVALDTALLLCPLLMGGMMLMMMRKSR